MRCDIISFELEKCLQESGNSHSLTFVRAEKLIMAKKKITETAEEMLEEFLKNNGYELYNIEYVKEGKDRFLRVYIDWALSGEERYISTDDCEKVSRFLGDKLDELDLFPDSYYLEVSSPGLDRVLYREKDYIRFSGKEVEISLYEATHGKKKFAGTLKGLAEGKIIITDEKGNLFEFQKEQVARTRLKVVF